MSSQSSCVQSLLGYEETLFSKIAFCSFALVPVGADLACDEITFYVNPTTHTFDYGWSLSQEA